MENNNTSLNICRKIFDLSSSLFGGLSSNQRKSLVYRLLNYLRAGNYKRVNNEVLKLVNTLDIENEKKEFLDHWNNIYCNENNSEFEKIAYSFLMGLLKNGQIK